MPLIPLVLLSLLAALPVRAAEAPRVVVSIAPIHSLVAAVTHGVVAPELLIRSGASPHEYALRPSEVRSLTEADVVVWVGAGLEGVLARPLESLADGTPRLTLMEAEGIRLLPARSGGLWAGPQDEGHGHGGDGHNRAGADSHLWLAPTNAAAIVTAVAETLAAEDPDNAERYRRNAAQTRTRIAELERALAVRLAPVRAAPYLVFHDAYRYFEDAFGLQPVGTVAVDPDRRPGARRLASLQEVVKARGVRCIFAEPQFRSDIVDVVAEGSGARHAELDPVGSDLEPGPELWFELMEGLAEALVGCLAGD